LDRLPRHHRPFSGPATFGFDPREGLMLALLPHWVARYRQDSHSVVFEGCIPPYQCLTHYIFLQEVFSLYHFSSFSAEVMALLGTVLEESSDFFMGACFTLRLVPEIADADGPCSPPSQLWD
jgi:hypothetical protein